MTNAIIGLGHSKTKPKTFYDDLDYWAVQPELGLKVSMTTTIIGLHPTTNRPYTFYEANNIGLHPILIKPKSSL
jgi:hypothetical protein